MASGRPTKNDRQQTRTELREALKLAIDGEIRFGNRGEAARAELDQRWERMLDLLEKHLRPPQTRLGKR